MDSLLIYFAGALFSHKELVGNALLASAIDCQSEGRLQCSLPQHVEVGEARSIGIRNQDLLQVITADLALFNFDGTELDAGTVVEFMIAKMLDIPAVLLRTDFRAGGDQPEREEKWNLMTSGYPRTKVLIRNAMLLYHKARAVSPSLTEMIPALYNPLAQEIIAGFEEVKSLPSLLAGRLDHARTVYEWALAFPGGGLSLSSQELTKIIERKARLGLI